MIRICHISTLHARNDVRIFQKELKSLSKHYKTYFIVADGLGDEIQENIQILDIGLRNSSRIKRLREDSKKAFQKALEIDCDLYHLHDPELMKIGLKLKKQHKKVIFDAHEDLPKQIMTKEYIPKTLRKAVSWYYKKYESKFSKKIDAVIAATPWIEKKFKRYGATAISLCNYPIPDFDGNKKNTSNDLVYIGGISSSRGILTMLDLITNTTYTLKLAGLFFNREIEAKAKAHPGWKQVEWLGFVDSREVKSILKDAAIGLVLLEAFESYKASLPVKMFEYMNAGLPYIASNFPIWEEINRKHNCGICVDPSNLSEIRTAIDSLHANPKKAKQMGLNGQQAIKTSYNWHAEEQKLLDLYKQQFKL